MKQVERVEFYSGMKGEESPRRVFLEDGVIEVVKIVEMSIVQDVQGERNRVYVFTDKDKNIYKLISKGEQWQMFSLS